MLRSTFTSFELIVDPLPVITDTVELKQCDDDTDGFSLFNLNEAASDISTNYLNETFVFYPSLLDAENDTMPLLLLKRLSLKTER